jgi:AraC-like DNA-binding protein
MFYAAIRPRQGERVLNAIRSAPKTPLHKSPLYAGGDVESLSAAITPLFGDNRIELERGAKTLDARVNVRRLKKTALCYGKLSQPFCVEVAESTSFVHGFPIRGTAHHFNNGNSIPDCPAKGAVGAPGPLKLCYGPGFELFAVFMSPQSLLTALSAIAGTPIASDLRLEKSNYGSRPESPLLRRLVWFLIAELDREGPDLSPLVLAELEQAILVAFLCGVDHNYSRLLNARPSSATPWQVRRVEEYIEANWDQPIAIEALAIVANASARSIFHSFREYRGHSPSNFVKQVRLRHARETLSRPTEETTVTRVAFDCGFGNLGHFASDYHRAFGETPSTTLNRSKGRC